MSDFPRGVIVKDLTAKWAKIGGETAPTNAFGAVQWEMTVQTTDPAKAEELRGLDLKVKEAEEDGQIVYSVNLKRKGFKASGEANAPVKVVDAAVQPMDGKGIGNGSKVNVNLWQYAYEFAGRSGISTSLTAVQVVDLVEYSGGSASSGGFEAVATAAATEESPF